MLIRILIVTQVLSGKMGFELSNQDGYSKKLQT